MAQNIYTIQLLNDIHTHFPDILYNPSRFRNVQDLLEYIRSVADSSPYSRGLQAYNRQRTNTPSGSIPSRASSPRVMPTYTTSFYEYSTNPNNTMPATQYRYPINQNNTLLNGLLGGLFSEILMTPSTGLESFLNQTVEVAPTIQEINNATNTYTANGRQENICTVCQDTIEQNQVVRQLNHCSHYFHKDCVDVWFARNVHCPTCRHDIRETNSEAEGTRSPPVHPNYRRANMRNDNNLNN
jgi:hypothetical protein